MRKEYKNRIESRLVNPPITLGEYEANKANGLTEVKSDTGHALKLPYIPTFERLKTATGVIHKAEIAGYTLYKDNSGQVFWNDSGLMRRVMLID